MKLIEIDGRSVIMGADGSVTADGVDMGGYAAEMAARAALATKPKTASAIVPACEHDWQPLTPSTTRHLRNDGVEQCRKCYRCRWRPEAKV